MADKVQIWNPKGVWTLIDRDLGQIIDHSPSKFLDVPVMEGKKKQTQMLGLEERMIQSQLAMGPPEVVIEECSFEQSGYTIGEKHWNIPTLMKAVRDQKCRVFDLPLASLDLSACPWKETQRVEDIIYHANRAYRSDLKYPIILDWHGYVCDGWHRIVKAVVLRHQTIRAYRLKELVKPDYDGENKDGSN